MESVGEGPCRVASNLGRLGLNDEENGIVERREVPGERLVGLWNGRSSDKRVLLSMLMPRWVMVNQASIAVARASSMITNRARGPTQSTQAARVRLRRSSIRCFTAARYGTLHGGASASSVWVGQFSTNCPPKISSVPHEYVMLFSIGLCYRFWLPRGEGACGRRGRLSRDIDNLIWRLTLGVLAIMIFVGSAGTSRADTTPKADRFPAQAEHDPCLTSSTTHPRSPRHSRIP